MYYLTISIRCYYLVSKRKKNKKIKNKEISKERQEKKEEYQLDRIKMTK